MSLRFRNPEKSVDPNQDLVDTAFDASGGLVPQSYINRINGSSDESLRISQKRSQQEIDSSNLKRVRAGLQEIKEGLRKIKREGYQEGTPKEIEAALRGMYAESVRNGFPDERVSNALASMPEHFEQK